MRNLFFLLVFSLLIPIFGQAQSKTKLSGAAQKELKLYEDTLGILSFLVINDSLPESRFAATRKMILTLKKALKVSNSYQYKFERLKPISIQYAPDSTFRIFTWQLFVDDNTYHYYGVVQMNSPELKMYPLVDRSAKIEDVQQAVLGADNWYGVIYYNIIKLNSPTGPQYLLFGLDTYSFFKRRKIIDVLTFKDDQLVFGATVFPKTINNDGPVNRLLLEYSAETSVKMNWDAAMEMIVFDHLIPFQGSDKSGPVNVPDGTYESFKINKGQLVYSDKLETQLLDEAPAPQPLSGKKNVIYDRTNPTGKKKNNR
ncbi:MAG TPA: hypothetical protein PLC89_17360 [Haliscomenobacter sp.]|uniref:hypothetical protein n=1 Tax=Haliscomenobacter sp. TaxID=2717303 RepID=UPI002CD0965B|nr:hypothetical protein [Haliscomenobacter sp.]HOY19078.1 hypothetical protein [Haliscomenobacter sp.]HPH20681.1 hypothetical protein [Haliscomenobacter sp.]